MTPSPILPPTFDDVFAYADKILSPDEPPKPAVSWILDNFIDPITKRSIHLVNEQKRVLREACSMTSDGFSVYSLIVWSQIKKSGKTTIAGAVGAWAGNEIEVPNEISCVANDQEQSAGRIFAAMLPTLERLNWYVPRSPKGQPIAYGKNGSVVKAITTNYKGEAGGNQGVSLWSELWAYQGERLSRLWEEMTPPPTRKFRMRWVETYAGFRQESALLYGIYSKIFKDTGENAREELNSGVVQIWDDLPVYVLEEENMLVFWDHIPRMPWQTKDYYRDQRTKLRPSAYTRLHENRWVDSAENFITDAMWKASLRADGPSGKKATYAIDGSINNDCTAIVGCVREGKVVRVTDVYIFEPKNGQEIDQNEVMALILDLYKRGMIEPPLFYDPYQLVKMAQDLRLKGVRCTPFSQQGERIKSDSMLYQMFNEGRLITWDHPGLRQHVLGAHAEYVGKDKKDLRIVKPGEGGTKELGNNAGKVDAAVALSMAAYKAYTRPSTGWTTAGI